MDKYDFKNLNDLAAARSFLSESNWPPGLQDTLIRNLSKIPIRYFICDDSGSMTTNDGHRTLNVKNTKKFVSCSRWTEMTEALRFHAGFSDAARVSSEFRFLNGETARVGSPDGVDKATFNAVLDGTPGKSLIA